MRTKSWMIIIGASKERIWRTMLDDATYRQWTSPFSESSYAVTDWQEGSKVLFLDGQGSGMVSRIAEHRPNEFLSIEHLGEVKDGIEDTSSDAVKSWAGARENYTLSGNDKEVTLTVHLDLDEKHESMFDEMWPKALAKLKELAES
ncbi:MAG: SRPBCC domain-containing protein [Bryobacteraceae bacterium]